MVAILIRVWNFCKLESIRKTIRIKWVMFMVVLLEMSLIIGRFHGAMHRGKGWPQIAKARVFLFRILFIPKHCSLSPRIKFSCVWGSSLKRRHSVSFNMWVILHMVETGWEQWVSVCGLFTTWWRQTMGEKGRSVSGFGCLFITLWN